MDCTDNSVTEAVEIDSIPKNFEIPSNTSEERYQDFKYRDAVSSTSFYNQVRNERNKTSELSQKYKNKAVEELLMEYQNENTDPNLKKWLKEEVFFRIFFLIPFVIKKSNYQLSSTIFNDCVQNISLTVFKAIDKFDPTRGFPLVNYLAGYFKGAISKTFRDANIISVPSNKRKELCDAPYNIKLESIGCDINYSSNCACVSREYVDNESIGAPEVNFEEKVHNIQLKEWLEDILSSEANVLTDDERMILLHHYGVFGAEKKSYKYLAKMRELEGRGHTHCRISQIRAKALEKIKAYFDKCGIEQF